MWVNPRAAQPGRFFSGETKVHLFRNTEIISGFKCQLNCYSCCQFQQVALLPTWQEVRLCHHPCHNKCHQAVRVRRPHAPSNTTVSDTFDSWQFSSCISCWKGLKINVFCWWMWLPWSFWRPWWLSSVLVAAVNMQAKQRYAMNMERNQIIWFWWRCVKL